MKHKPKRFIQAIYFISLTGTILQERHKVLVQTLGCICPPWWGDSRPFGGQIRDRFHKFQDRLRDSLRMFLNARPKFASGDRSKERRG